MSDEHQGASWFCGADQRRTCLLCGIIDATTVYTCAFYRIVQPTYQIDGASIVLHGAPPSPSAVTCSLQSRAKSADGLSPVSPRYQGVRSERPLRTRICRGGGESQQGRACFFAWKFSRTLPLLRCIGARAPRWLRMASIILPSSYPLWQSGKGIGMKTGMSATAGCFGPAEMKRTRVSAVV